MPGTSSYSTNPNSCFTTTRYKLFGVSAPKGLAAKGSIDLGGRGVLSSPGRSTNSTTAIGAASPCRCRVRTTLVYPPCLSLYRSANNVNSLCCSFSERRIPCACCLALCVLCNGHGVTQFSSETCVRWRDAACIFQVYILHV
jgi:hypothetical protein